MNKVDIILKNAIVLTIDNEYRIYEPGAIAITDNIITAVDREPEILESYESNEVIDCEGKILMPGLINAHTHLPMAILRGIMDDLRLDEWLNDYIFPTEGNFVTPKTVKLGTELACAELIKSGCTSVLDMYYYPDVIADSLIRMGMRGICDCTIMCFPGVDNIPVDGKFENAEKFIKKYKDNKLIKFAIGPHAPYTNSEETIKRSISFAKKHDVLLNMHLAEAPNEGKDLTEKYGSVSGYLEKMGFYDIKCNFAHCVHLTDDDIKAFAKHNIGIAHNPTSNMKLASGAAPTTAMLAAGVNVGIGTDGNSSNNDLDMFEEMRMASFLAKIQADSPTALTAKEVIYMATRGGAKSIFLDSITGSLEAGKRADLITVDINTLHNLPRFRHNPDGLYGQLIYATKSTDVCDVMCDGKWLMRNKELKTIDVKPLLKEAQKLATDIDKFVLGLKAKKTL